MTPFARLALPLFALAALGAGCAGYRLGSPVPEELRAIHVPAFENNTEYPMVGAVAAQQFLDALIEEGIFEPTDFEHARLRTQVIVTGIAADAVSYDRNNAILPDEYRVTLRARLYAYDARTGETLINGKPVSATDSALTRNDFQTGVMDAIPRLSRKLAQNLLVELHGIAPTAALAPAEPPPPQGE